MGKIKEFIQNHLVDIVISASVIVFVFGIWLLYTANRTANDYSDVHESVERAEAGIDRAESGARSAQAEIKNAEVHVKRADETAGKLGERTKRNAEELDECQHIADRMSERSERIQSIIADVEKANQGNGAQAESHA
uniref:hypothetical protein n=1 Tax=uncultured Allisonella sp. TaxID=339338 RepID=UPI00267047E9|nr:hypothetical protein [uncultured Allisonella sp.]